MRGWVLLAFLIIVPGVSALQVADTDFTSGNHFYTAFSNGNLVLANISAGVTYTNGNYSSNVTPGMMVKWTNISWIAQTAAGETVKLQVRTGNTSTPDDTWTPFSANLSAPQSFSAISQYIQFMVILESGGASTPTVQEVNLSYDLLPLIVQLVSPVHNTVSASPNITFVCGASSSYSIQNITLYTTVSGNWSANATMVGNNSASFTLFNVPDGTYVWNCLSQDSAASAFASQNNTVVVAATNTPPVIVGTQVTPSLAAPNTTIVLGINATDANGVSAVWATVTSPNNTMRLFPLINNDITSFVADEVGTYLISFFVNDTLGAAVNVQRSLTIANTVTINGSVQDPSGSLTANISIIQAASIVTQTQSAFSAPILAAPFDIRFSLYNGDFDVRINGVQSGETDKIIRADKVAADGYSLVYAIINPYTFSNGEVTLRYPDTGFEGDAVTVFVCATWNFTSRSCTGSYTQASGFSLDPTTNTIHLNVTSFSGFALAQEGFCGDGICNAGETQAGCSTDCVCQDGQTQSCGSLSIGECKSGMQTCASGVWGTCVGEVPPSSEKCNRKDDDCDGIVDNVNGGTLLEETQCRCFIGAPTQEVCNDIDDDCDGQIDGFSKACGSNIGVCKEGTQICTRGVFGTCTGGISPQDEVCENSLDDNCNADTDENCPLCTDGIKNGLEEGVDCGGSCPNACTSIFSPILLLPAIVIVGLLAAVYILKFRKTSWSKLEKKYSYSPS